MTEKEKDIWCNDCGVRMARSGERIDIITKAKKPIVNCPMCRKWEFVKDG